MGRVKSEWKPDDRNFILARPEDTRRSQAEEGHDLIYAFKDHSGGMALPRKSINKSSEKRSLRQNRVFAVRTGAVREGPVGVGTPPGSTLSLPSFSYLPYHHPLT